MLFNISQQKNILSLKYFVRKIFESGVTPFIPRVLNLCGNYGERKNANMKHPATDNNNNNNNRFHFSRIESNQ